MKKAIAGLSVALAVIIGFAGCPAGLLTLEDGVCEGYTLVCNVFLLHDPGRQALLLDMDGNIVHRWPISGFPAKMLPGGSLLGGTDYSDGFGTNDSTATVQVSWDGDEEWSYSNWVEDGGVMRSRQHHDCQREGNPVGYYAPGQDFVEQGNTLILAHEDRLVPGIASKTLLDDVIYEVGWEGNQTGFVWYAADHIDEMGFSTEARQAIRNRIDMGNPDWLHVNSVSFLGENHWYDDTGDERFNPQNIILDSRTANVMLIISKETGEILWQVGPEYGPGTEEEGLGQMIGFHHAHMIPKGLPGAGNILVFDNGGLAGYGGLLGFPRYIRFDSRVVEFDPTTLEIVWEYGTGPCENFFSVYVSAAQRLPNGNTLITDGDSCRAFEVTADKEIVWDYALDFVTLEGVNNIYRAYRIPPEWLPEGENTAGYPAWASLYE